MPLFGRPGKGNPFDWLVVGLGNPGEKYARTRHNVGEEVVRLLAERHDSRLKGGRDDALVAETRFDDQRVVLAFPLTFMNESGRSVSKLVRRYRIEGVPVVRVIRGSLSASSAIFAARASTSPNGTT